MGLFYFHLFPVTQKVLGDVRISLSGRLEKFCYEI